MAKKEKQKKVNWDELIYAYALENALEFGKAQDNKVLPKLFQHGLEKKQIRVLIPKIKEIVSQVNNLKDKERQEKFQQYSLFVKKPVHKEKTLKPLPNTSRNMVFRLAPFPSGALHLGNAKTYVLNALYAEKYKGKIILVMDDTIGSAEKKIMPESYDLIKDAFKFLNVKYSKVVYKSDRLKIYYKYAEQIIKKGKAYVCDCSQEEIKKNRINKMECSCRQFDVDLQLKRWKKMFKSKPGSHTLRIKTSMQDPNPAFRDRVLFRISNRTHPRTKKKYKVWPLLEFSWAIDDHLLGITHIIRGKDLMIESEMEKYIWDIFKWKHPTIVHSGLVKIEEAVISKSKAQKEILNREYESWDDPRTWSVQSLGKRGILAESIKKFIEEIGLNENDITVPVESLYAINRKILDKDAQRYFFVELPLKLNLKEIPIQETQLKFHPDKKETRKVNIGEIFISKTDFEKYKGEEIRLLNLFNIDLAKKEHKKTKVTDIKNKSIPKIHWVSSGVETEIIMPNGFKMQGIAEQAVENLKPGQVIQFERFGFCKYQEYNKKQRKHVFYFGHQ